MTPPDPRRLAWQVLRRVETGGPLPELLDDAMARLPADRDRRRLSELVRGTLRWQGRYDTVLDRLARPGLRVRPPVRTALRLGLHQLLAMDGVPVHAAVHATVDLARHAGGAGAARFANAVLREVARRLARAPAGEEPAAALRDLFPDPAADPAGWLSAWHSHPRWLVERWLARWGQEAVEALLRHDNAVPPQALAVLPPADPEAERQALDAAGVPVAPGRLSPRALVLQRRLSRRELGELLAARRDLLVQDEAVLAATEFLLTGAAAPAADLCAAPGGKTLHLLRRLPPGGVTALDRDRRRLPDVRAAAKRIAAAPPAVVCADGRRPPLRPGTLATLLLDGPCSGTGVLRRHPEGRWRLRPETPARNGERLLALALAAADLLRPGGRLLYGTCSLEPEENEQVVARLREARPDLVPDPVDGAWERHWRPWRDGADGFYAARLRREVDA